MYVCMYVCIMYVCMYVCMQTDKHTCMQHKGSLAELKITAGHWPFSVQFSTMIAANCTDGQSIWWKPYFSALALC